MIFSNELAKLSGMALWQRFAALCQDAAKTQEQLAWDLIQSNAASRFGQDYNFAAMRSVDDFRQQVPLRQWDEFEPYTTALIHGETDILTHGQPVLRFIHSSGTTGTPKLIPSNAATQQARGVTLKLRLLTVVRDHPEILSGGGSILALANPAVGGYTPGGTPYGTVSGVAMDQMPPELAGRFACPPAVLEIADLTSRAYAILRFALVSNLGLAITNNPQDFIRLFDYIPEWAETLVADIRDGEISTPTPLPPELRQRLESALQPNPKRAAQLEALGANLNAAAAWPQLHLVVCWKTGLMSRFLKELAARCPHDTIFREYGYGASEGVFTIPLQDDSSAGVLTIHDMFFEFLPEETPVTPNAPTLLAHELKVGERYQIILTTAAGLYRYVLGDLIEVNGFLGQAPQITFLRKVGDVLNLVGEKINAHQVAQALEFAQQASEMTIHHYQLVADEATLSYELCVETAAEYGESQWQTLLHEFDQQLCAINHSYEMRCQQGLFKLPKLRRMRSGWLDALKQRGGYQAKPKVVGYQLAESEYTDGFIALEESNV